MQKREIAMLQISQHKLENKTVTDMELITQPK